MTGTLTGTASGLLGPVTGTLTGTASGLLGPVTGTLTGAASGLLGPVTGTLTGAASGLLGPVTGTLTGAASGLLGPVTGTLTGAASGLWAVRAAGPGHGRGRRVAEPARAWRLGFGVVAWGWRRIGDCSGGTGCGLAFTAGAGSDAWRR